jgi:hypothetical protein
VSIEFIMAVAAENLISLSNRTLFERLSEPDFIETVFVVALDLSPIQERMGPDRWSRRKEQVWEHLGRSLERRILGDESYQRITETGFIVALTRPARPAAVAVGAHALQDTLHFFLGQAVIEDIKIREVQSVTGAELTCKPLGADEIRKAAASWVLGGGGEDSEEPVYRQSPVKTLQTPSGRLLTVMIAVQRITRLVPDRPAALRAEPFVHDPKTGRRLGNPERRALDSSDIGAIDAAVLTLARGIWENEPELGPIMVPISFHTVSRTGARTKLLREAGIVADETRGYLLSEITDMASGTPAGRFAEAVAMTRVFSRGVFVEAADPSWLKTAMGGVRLVGLTFDASDVREHQAASLTKKLFGFAEVGRSFARGLIAHSLPSPAMVDVCRAAGLTHACMRAEPSSPIVRINDRG